MTVLIHIPAAAKERDPQLRVAVNPNGSVTVSVGADDFHFTSYDSVRIYKAGEWITPGSAKNPPPLVWWFARPGRTITYPGERDVPVMSSRTSELSAGEGSALAPGKYYAVILGRQDIFLSEAIDFEITEITDASPSFPPTPPADTEPVFLPATPSLSPDLPSASFPAFHRPPVKTPGEFYYGSDEAELGNGIAALAVIILSIITFFLILHKRK